MANVIRIGGGGAGGSTITLPPMVTNLAASTGDRSITLTWTNPDSDALVGILIVYNSEHVPEKISDGTKVDAGLVETHTLTGLTNETLYYIRVFPYNEKKQYQTMLEGATVTATPDDFPEEPTSYSEIKQITTSEEWVVPENGYYQIDIVSKSGDGGTAYYNGLPRQGGGGGGSGAIARKSQIALTKGQIVNIVFSDGSIQIEELGMSVTAGGRGADGRSGSVGVNGGAGGVASGGDINIQGLRGRDGYVNSDNGPNATAQGGTGGITYNDFGYTVQGGTGGTNSYSVPTGYGSTGTSAFAVLFRGNTNVPSPSAASTLSLTPRNASIEASWTNSEDPESVGNLLVSNFNHEPQDITDGTAVDVAEATSYTLTDLPNDKPTYISLFSYNADKSKYSAAKSNVEIPREVTWADTQDILEENLETTTAELETTTVELAENQAMVASASSALTSLIVLDIQNDTNVISDNMILDNADMLSKPWEVGTPNEVGDIVWYMLDDVKQYYKVVQHTENADPLHTPNLVPAVFVAVNRTNAGTIDDPIPAVRGMEYEYGKYYLDNEDGKIYICKRGEETGSIVLQYLPHELIGQYFEEVTE